MMKRMAGIINTLSFSVATMMLATLLSGCGGGASPVAPLPQTIANGNNAPGTPQDTVTLTSAQLAEKATYTNFRYHIMPISKPGTVHDMGVVFPLDMTKGTGTVLKATTQNDIFVNTTSAAVGTPTTFQANFNLSTFIGVLNQYDGVTSTGKFPVGTSFIASPLATYSNVINQDQLFAVIHAAAKVGGAGYGHEYHVFLASGLDTCIDFGPCYSPDNVPTWVFCAYHGSLTYSDIGHVIYSIEPYQNVAGCGDVGLSVPNPAPIDSTATTLSHETSESISDPDPNTGWFNATFGMEIGDVCNTLRATETLNGHKYLIQPEYSNSAHGCFF